ncbi:hypothetical protein OCV51_10535 [Faecalicatena acetigenes]|uniref:Uncharacterized protein n=1 Tax=Faecalicatena acetigenes TaxID=2981790 RepID=A0ABT2TCS1_9FIRM|nr:hypothetical protein [Faecalicatena acetigenes]MCU6748083.1 hypothetical protein [Faecalicatena acetigenes]SCI24653.1 Uncharacterised protein [uncultured Clostridium sp.]
MTTIILKNGYCIEVSSLNYTLRQKYIGKTKSGEPKEAFRTYGHFRDIEGALRKYIELSQIDVLEDEKLTIEEYIEQIRKINSIALQGKYGEIKRFLKTE